MKMPDNYRIAETCYGGSGHGDEMFGLALEVYEARNVKRFLRKPRVVVGWWEVERRARQNPEDIAFLQQTANLRAKEVTVAY